jgi:hypothetical protein
MPLIQKHQTQSDFLRFSQNTCYFVDDGDAGRWVKGSQGSERIQNP